MFDCVVMEGAITKSVGSWKVENCYAKKGFVCKRNVGECATSLATDTKQVLFFFAPSPVYLVHLPPNLLCLCACAADSQIAVPPTTASTGAFYKLGNDSYKLLTEKMKWDEARRQCQADDGDLASVLDPVSQAFITLQMHKHNEPVWIGLNSNVVGVLTGERS